MTFTYLTNIALEKAREDYLTNLREAGLQPKIEIIATINANHRVTAEAVYARIQRTPLQRVRHGWHRAGRGEDLRRQRG